MLHTSLQRLREHEACRDGLIEAYGIVGWNVDEYKFFPLALGVGKASTEYLIWAIHTCREYSHSLNMDFAADMAEKVLTYFPQPEYDHLRGSIQILRDFVHCRVSSDTLYEEWERVREHPGIAAPDHVVCDALDADGRHLVAYDTYITAISHLNPSLDPPIHPKDFNAWVQDRLLKRLKAHDPETNPAGLIRERVK